jgi:hypothetical protein
MEVVDSTGLSDARCGQSAVALEMASELGNQDGVIACQVEGWFAGTVPAVVAGAAGETHVENTERRVVGDVATGGTAPGSRERSDRHPYDPSPS